MKDSSPRKRLLLLIGSAVVFAVAVTAEQRIEQRVVERSAPANVKSMIAPAVTRLLQSYTPSSQAELSNTEDRIQTSRRFYNNNVQDYNRRVQSFPSAVIANMFHFKEEQFFEVDEALREAGAPQVNFGSGPAVSFGGGPAVPGATPPAPAPTPPAGMPPAEPPPPPS